MFYPVLITLAAFIVTYPCLRLLVKRLILAYRLKCVCDDKGYVFHPTHRAWIFDGINDTRVSFYVECREKVYSVKLTGSGKRSRFINFIDPTHYSLRCFYGHFRGFVGGLSIWEDIGYRKKAYDFTYMLPPSCVAKELISVVLVCPVPAVVLATRGNRSQEIGDGDHMGEGYLYSRRGFLALLEGI